MREGRNAAHVVNLTMLVYGPGSETGDEVNTVVLGVRQEANHVGVDGRVYNTLYQEGLLSLQVIAAISGLGEPDLVYQLGLNLALQSLNDGRIVEGRGAVFIIVGVLANLSAILIGEVVLGVIVRAAVHLHGAVFVVLSHGLGGSQILVPGPLGGQLAQTGFFPGSHVDGNIVAQTAAGEGVDALIQLEGVGAPVGNQIDAFFFNQISQLLIQAGFPALVNVGQAEGSQNVHFARHDGGVNGQVAVGVVVVGVQGNLDVGVHGVEVRDQRVHALGTLEGHPEGDVAGDGSVFFQNPAGVKAFSASCEHGQQHDDRQEKRDEFLHGVVLLFISYDRMAPTINSNLERSKFGQNEI